MNVPAIIVLQVSVFALLVWKIWQQGTFLFVRVCGVICIGAFSLMSLISIPQVITALEDASANSSMFFYSTMLIVALSAALAQVLHHRMRRTAWAVLISVVLTALVVGLLTWIYLVELAYLPRNEVWPQLRSPWEQVTPKGQLFMLLIIGYSCGVGLILTIHNWLLVRAELNYAVRVRQGAALLSSASLTAAFFVVAAKQVVIVRNLAVPEAPFLIAVLLLVLLSIFSFALQVLPRFAARPVTRWLVALLQLWDLWQLQPLLRAIQRYIDLAKPSVSLVTPPMMQLCKAAIYILDGRALLATNPSPEAQRLFVLLDKALSTVDDSELQLIELVGASKRASQELTGWRLSVLKRHLVYSESPQT